VIEKFENYLHPTDAICYGIRHKTQYAHLEYISVGVTQEFLNIVHSNYIMYLFQASEEEHFLVYLISTTRYNTYAVNMSECNVTTFYTSPLICYITCNSNGIIILHFFRFHEMLFLSAQAIIIRELTF
jgi:hypothetical protein